MSRQIRLVSHLHVSVPAESRNRNVPAIKSSIPERMSSRRRGADRTSRLTVRTLTTSWLVLCTHRAGVPSSCQDSKTIVNGRNSRGRSRGRCSSGNSESKSGGNSTAGDGGGKLSVRKRKTHRVGNPGQKANPRVGTGGPLQQTRPPTCLHNTWHCLSFQVEKKDTR